MEALIRPFGRFVALAAIGLLFWLWTAPAAAAPDVLYGSSSAQGDWVGRYGADGYVLAGWSAGHDVTAMPGVDVSLVQGDRWLWGSYNWDVRELENAEKSARAAATYWDPNEIQLRLRFNAAYSGQLALYALDAESAGRRETITVGGETAELSSDFSQGAWVSVPISVAEGGSVSIDVDRTAGPNAVLSGIFLGGGGTSPVAYTSTPQGGWVGRYGADGYVLAAWSSGHDVTAMPGVDVGLVRGNRWLWGSYNWDVRELENADKSARAAAAYWDPNEVQVRLTFKAAYSGRLALYALDAESAGRRETITVAGATAYLSSDFSQGAWVVVPISVAAGGSVTIGVDRTAGPNAVLSGVFLGGGGTPPPLPPTNTGLPAINGSAVQTHTLTTSSGTWTGSPSSYAYQWQACDAGGTGCSAISGAVTSSYTLTSSDVGHAIRAVVSATNRGGSASQASAPTGVVNAPSPSGPPDSGPCGVQGGPYDEGNWPGGNWVPYACRSPWNTQLPAYDSAWLDPASQSETSYMSTNWSPHFTSQSVSNDPTQDTASTWADPIYWARSSDPTYTIEADHMCTAPAATSCPLSVQIPDGAVPSAGSDAHLAVIQPDGHTEVDFWQVHNTPPLRGGGTLTASAYGALDLNGSGCCGNSTAANEGLPAGAIRGPELAAGIIKHALAVTEVCSNGEYVPPATGRGAPGCPDAPPIGARMQLKMSDSQITALDVPAYQKTILTAMAHYGLFITDTGGSPVDLKYEPAVQYTVFGNTSNTVMSYIETQGYSDPAWIDIKLPWSDFQIVSPCYAQGTC